MSESRTQPSERFNSVNGIWRRGLGSRFAVTSVTDRPNGPTIAERVWTRAIYVASPCVMMSGATVGGRSEVPLTTRESDTSSTDGNREIRFARLTEAAACCQACERMRESPAVLSERNGSLKSRLLFVAEAPGRLGAARTGVPLTGDQSGRNFERLLAAAGLTREGVFVTNAVLCNPLDERGRNAPPNVTEIHHCLDYLRRTLEIVDPVIVVTLGAVALRALGEIVLHRLLLNADAGRPSKWNGRLLIPMYHPGARAQLHRSFERQLQDFASLGLLIRDQIQS